ncbi:MAG: putative selenium-dependent hydroxylase accessory protein YqeC [Anaerolineae bacterium]|nr:putative selenium-dependent hydroxylase accessory protein YqeC [Anaerolineae bacterium]
MRLREALDVNTGDVVAFVGAGGKTTALARLARECAADGLRVLATTTTRIAADELALFDRVESISAEGIVTPCERGQALFVYDRIEGEKATGSTPDRLAGLIAALRPNVTLIEADGARRLPLKLPKAHEPVIPAETTLVVNLASLNAIGQPLDEAHVYNAQGLAAATGSAIGAHVTVDLLAAALREGVAHTRARLTLPAQREMRLAVYLNAVPPTGVARVYADRAARKLLAGRAVERVLIGSAQAHDPVDAVRRRTLAIVLAAGMSQRMGQPKVLLPWGGQTVLQRILSQLIGSVDDIIVITGAQREAVEAIAEHVGAAGVNNPDYAAGEMLSSLQVGLRALIERDAQAALVVLGDQPMMRAANVRKIVRAYAQGKGGIIAPSHAMRRGHPILVDRRYWQEILDLPPASAPRDVINRHAADSAYVETDDSVLRDIDTPAAYQEELRRAGLNPLDQAQ